MTLGVLAGNLLTIGIALAGFRPVPAHFGGHATARIFGDVASLTGHLGCVLVQSLILFMRCVVMTGDTGCRVTLVVLTPDMSPPLVHRRWCVATAGHVMTGGLVTGRASEVESGGIHVNVEIPVRRGQ